MAISGDDDHYAVLGLPSGEEGASLSEQEINKAYRIKAKELHPDKRPNDPDAHADFLKLQYSYTVLRFESTRKLFDNQQRLGRSPTSKPQDRPSKRKRQQQQYDDSGIDDDGLATCYRLRMQLLRFLDEHDRRWGGRLELDSSPSSFKCLKIKSGSKESDFLAKILTQDEDAVITRELKAEMASTIDVHTREVMSTKEEREKQRVEREREGGEDSSGDDDEDVLY